MNPDRFAPSTRMDTLAPSISGTHRSQLHVPDLPADPDASGIQIRNCQSLPPDLYGQSSRPKPHQHIVQFQDPAAVLHQYIPVLHNVQRGAQAAKVHGSFQPSFAHAHHLRQVYVPGDIKMPCQP